MEHRWRSRSKTSAPVVLLRKHGETIDALVRNISPGGMLLDLGIARLDAGEVVGVMWPVHCLRGDIWPVQAAMVMHTRGAMVGLMFAFEQSMDVMLGAGIDSPEARLALLH